jgi:soluble lytic murein transglycosylase
MSTARSGIRNADSTRSASKRRTRAAVARRTRFRRFVFALIALLCVGVAIGVWRFDFGEKIQELTLPLRHDDIIRQQAREKDVPADLIAAVIYKESKFEDQTSSAGARGLMQITPATADTIENLSGGQTFVYDDLANPDLNIRYGTFYLHYLIEKYDDNLVAVLSAYNAGEGNADAWGGVAMKESDIEFPETRDYVDEILEKRVEYRKKYADELGL